MPSGERETDAASKPNLRATTSTHSRVRSAVIPARIIKAPNDKTASTASISKAVSSSLLETEDVRYRDRAFRCP